MPFGHRVGFTGKGWAPGVARHADGSPRAPLGTAFQKRKAPPPTTGISGNDYAANFVDFLDAAPAGAPWLFWYGGTERAEVWGRPAGLAIAGDGSLLMNLGSLVTIASVAPRNLVHFVCENDTYEANGAHPIPGAGQVDFAGLARAAGYRRVHDFAALDDFASRVGDVLREDGPVFATLRVVPGAPSPQDFPALHSLASRRAFVERLEAS